MDEMFLREVLAQAEREILEFGSVTLVTQIDLHEAIMASQETPVEYVSAGY